MRDVSLELSIGVKARLVAGTGHYTTTGLGSIGLEPMRLADGGNGIGGFQFDERAHALCLPCGSAQAASWEPELATALGRLVGIEARRLGVDVVLAPMINIPRSPLGGRAFECYGEDPLLAGSMAAAWIRGVQSAGVAATPKHFIGNDAERARARVDCQIDERALREIYLLPFELAARAGAWAVMAAYNRVNGTPSSEHEHLLTRILKDEWRWDGLVMSDWLGARDTVACAIGGTDLEMPGPPRVYGEPLAAAVSQGRVSEQRLDDMARRLLRLADRVGRLGAADRRSEPAPPQHAGGLLRDAAAAAFVLLRNEGGALPLPPEAVRTLAVIGPGAADPCFQGGGSSQVHMTAETPLDSITTRYEVCAQVMHEPGCSRRVGATPLHELDVRPERSRGAQGLTVEYQRAEDRDPFARELRAASRLLWVDGIPGMEHTGGRVRIACEFVPVSDGAHRFSVRASGSARLLIAGREVAATKPARDELDPFSVLFSDAEACCDVRLRRGLAITLELLMDVPPSSTVELLDLRCRPPEPAGGVDAAVAAAARADAVVLLVGTGDDIEREGADRATLHMPGRQEELGRRVIAANPRTIAVVNAGAQVNLRWARDAAALLYAWFPGQEFGPALAAVLTGDQEPGGRLPITLAAAPGDYPALDTAPDPALRRRYLESTLVGYRHLDAHGIEPEFCFGHGLCYTEFAYETITVSQRSSDAVTPLTVAVTLRNTGSQPGKEVVQLYVFPPTDATERRPSQLKAFAPVRLGPGERATVDLQLDERAFARWDVSAGAWTAEPGDHELRIGRSSRDIRLRKTISIRA